MSDALGSLLAFLWEIAAQVATEIFHKLLSRFRPPAGSPWWKQAAYAAAALICIPLAWTIGAALLLIILPLAALAAVLFLIAVVLGGVLAFAGA